MKETDATYCRNVPEWLLLWASWARGNQLIRGSRHVLAEMMRRAAGETPDRDTARPDNFSPQIHAVDKALAQMRLAGDSAPTPRGRRQLHQARRLIIGRYLGQRTIAELAVKFNVSEGFVQSSIGFGERYLAQKIADVYAELTKADPRR